jgi:hypothetical protein
MTGAGKRLKTVQIQISRARLGATGVYTGPGGSV